MASGKIYKKKLTNCGGGVCFLTTLAALVSCAAAAGDFIAVAVYNEFYNNTIGHLYANDVLGYLGYYGNAIAMAVFALFMMFWSFSAAGGRRMGKEFGMAGIFVNLAVCFAPALSIYRKLEDTAFMDNFTTEYDGDKFRAAVALGADGLPLLAGLLILMAAVGFLAKLGADVFVIEAPSGKEDLYGEDYDDDYDDYDDEEYEEVPVKKPSKKKSAKVDEKPAKKPAKQYEDDEEDYMTFGKNNDNAKADPKPVKKAPVFEDEYDDDYEEEYEKPAKPVKSENLTARQKSKSILLCKNCGELVDAGELFCPSCGKKM